MTALGRKDSGSAFPPPESGLIDGGPIRLVAVSTEIGRGHPAYLDSVLFGLWETPGFRPGRLRLVTIDQVCSGPSRACWSIASRLYRAGARGGLLTRGYNALRHPASGGGPLQRAALGAELRRRFRGFPGICLVEHPIVARILAPVCRVAYLHAEIAAPALAAVSGAWRSFVPLAETAARLQAGGVESGTLSVTGLVVECEIVPAAEAAFRARLRRYRSGGPLNVGLFTSGAYPKPHVDRIIRAAEAVFKAGHRPIVFAGTDRRMAEVMKSRIKVPFEGWTEPVPGGSSPLLLTAANRQEDTHRTAELFPELDAFVAAAHERTNWAVGLGLPMFVLLPHIGPFAPLNCEFAERQGVGLRLKTGADALRLGERITELRASGELAAMAERGYGRHRIDGAATVARTLVREMGDD